jgi:RimJ/RimL family protein N-acetyltransferase
VIEVYWAGSGEPDVAAGIARFVASHIPGGDRGFLGNVCMGVIKTGQAPKLIAGVVYHNWCPESGVIELSAASTSKLWLTRPVLREMFAYPFEQIGCQMAVLRVSERNPVMVSIALRYGFKSHLIPRLRGRDEAEHILTLTDDDWRENRFNQEKQ